MSKSRIEKLDSRKNFKLNLIDGAELVGKYGLPKIKACRSTPRNLIPFNAAKSEHSPENKWIHFFIDDYQFERIWNVPEKYLSILKRFEGVIATDFSMLDNMPVAQRIWNCYRNRALSYWMQNKGVNIVPTVEWALYDELEWCLDGLPKQSMLAIGTYGSNKNHLSRYGLIKGVERICKELEPTGILFYGNEIESINGLHRNIIWHGNYCKKFEMRI